MVSAALRRAVEGLDGPFGVIDRDALDRNTAALRARAAGLPIRVASKSVRVPRVLERVLAAPGYRGILAYSLPEALDLHRLGFRDIVVAYPTVHRAGIRALAADPEALAHITLMVDSAEGVDALPHRLGPDGAPAAPVGRTEPPGPTAAPGPSASPGPSATHPLRLCLDLDASLRPAARLTRGRVHLGIRRSPIRETAEALALAARIAADPRLRLVGVMSYEGQIAGLGDAGRGPRALLVRTVRRLSVAELAERRTRVITAIREVAELEFVNGGGTGSLESSADEGTLTELTVGSGLFSPGLYDSYRGFRHEPAAFFAVPVVRRPAPGWVTVAGGGWIASGAPGPDRRPTIAWPESLAYSSTEGPGEVQTPLHGPAADALALGDHVFLRHAKAGELAEHLTGFHVVADGEIIDSWSTYRGSGWAH